MKHLFKFLSLCSHKRQWETISWKSYFNLVCKRKGRLYCEQERDSVGNHNHLNTTETGTVQVMRTMKQSQSNTQNDSIANNDNFTTAFRDVTITDAMRHHHVSEQPRVNAQLQSEMEEDAKEEEKWKMQRQLDPGVSCSIQPVGFCCHARGCTINKQKNGCLQLVHNLCCQRFGLNGDDNELEMYCSFQCKAVNMSS